VDEEEVDVGEPKVFHPLVKGPADVVGAGVGVGQLGGDVDLLAAEPEGGDRLAESLLGAVGWAVSRCR
jgi:hypothetical protein